MIHKRFKWWYCGYYIRMKGLYGIDAKVIPSSVKVYVFNKMCRRFKNVDRSAKEVYAYLYCL